jgi:hypothetical protein
MTKKRGGKAHKTQKRIQKYQIKYAHSVHFLKKDEILPQNTQSTAASEVSGPRVEK